MSNLKVGDKARVVDNYIYKGRDGYENGSIVVISGALGHGFHAGPQGHDPRKKHDLNGGSVFYNTNTLEKYEEPVKTFRVGDRVRIVRQDGHSKVTPQKALRVGEEFQVKSVHEGFGDDRYARGDSGGHGVWFSNLELVTTPKQVEKFDVGDRVRTKVGGIEFTISNIRIGFATGKSIYRGEGVSFGVYADQIEHAPKPVEPAPKFKVGDRVVTNANGGPYKPGFQFTVTRVVKHPSIFGGGASYVQGDPNHYGVYENFLDLVKPREFVAGDLIRADKGEASISGRLSSNVYSGLTIAEAGWGIGTLKRDGFEITLVKAAPEPEPVDEFPLPTKDGLYMGQAYQAFRLTGKKWTNPATGQGVNVETLKNSKHHPLVSIPDPK